MKKALMWIVGLGIWMFTSGCACEPWEPEELETPAPGACEDGASPPEEATLAPGAQFAHCESSGAACFPEFSRWMRVTDPDPVVSEGRWHDFPADLGLSPVPAGRAPVALLPRPGAGSPEVAFIDVSALTLDAIRARVSGLATATAIAATAADEDQLRELAPLGGRVTSLVVQLPLTEPAALAPFTSLRALSVRAGRPFDGGQALLGGLERLELEVPPGSHTVLTGALRDLGVSPAHLRELKIQGEIDREFLRFLRNYRQLELLHLDWLVLTDPVELSPLSQLCRLRELQVQGGEGLFDAAWTLAAKLPRLRALSVRSLSWEPVDAARIPAGLTALRVEGRLSQADLEAISRLGTLGALSLAGKGGAGGEPLDLEPLRRLRVSRLELTGEFHLLRPVASVKRLRWIAMPKTRAIDLSQWTDLTHLDLTLTNAWALKLPATRRLLDLRIQDVAETPAPLSARDVAAALSDEATGVALFTDGLDRLPPAWPARLETLRLAAPRVDDGLWATLGASLGLRRLFLARAAVSRGAFDAFLKTAPTRLSVVQLHDTGIAPRRSLTFRGSPRSLPALQ